jgi:ribonuclease E
MDHTDQTEHDTANDTANLAEHATNHAADHAAGAQATEIALETSEEHGTDEHAAVDHAADEDGDLGVADADADADADAASEAAAETDAEADAEIDANAAPDPEAEADARADAEEAAAAYARASVRAFETEPEPRDEDADDPLVAHRGEKPRQLVVVNDVPGEETRIAILEQGKLAQFHSERTTTATNVGSIYKARVVNVEPAIQAAFVDFGEGANGFLHISDLHPKYFPRKKGAKDEADAEGDGEAGGDGKVRTEKVGRKIPRRARPMMQDALKRGQEIIVQVLKEGLGSKGPTVTSYLSIPGRLLVMMPDMDNVGVSRKVEDEEGRRSMRKILDSLDLPSGFGFILRTAGFSATRTELARDAQYLTRLWQVMEKRMNAVGAPCQLYAEGDILLRTIRDSIDQTVDGIVVDNEQAFHRAKAFLEVVSPRTATKVHFYDRKTPVFHAFDVERQVELLHSREVPLPSGGALVFDQAEALVAIDVNSGRSRSARDSETNAYQTNQEAVDEIARQLRLRDLGGVVVCDLIDMRSSKHRRDIEERLRRNLAKDRAKTTVGQISEFGIVEMTRQRMRPSIRKTHYTDCPHCAGSGEIRMPDSVAADTMRRIQLVLDMERVARVEVVCSARVASMLLSRRRRALVELEDLFAKRIDIRISESIAADRVDLYAYDDRNADVDLDRPQKAVIPALSALPTEIDDEDDDETPAASQGGGRKRRRRRRKPAAADATSLILAGGFDDLPDIDEDEPSVSDAIASEEAKARAAAKAAEKAASDARRDDDEGEGGGRRRRRRRRGGRGREDGESTAQAATPEPVAPREPSPPIRVHAIAKEMELTSKEVLAKCAELGIEVKGHQSMLAGEQGDELRKAYGKPPFDVPEPEPAPEPEPETDGEITSTDDEAGEGGRKRRRRRRRRGRGRRDEGDAEDGSAPESTDAQDDESDAAADAAEASNDERPTSDDAEESPRKRRRRRGGRGRKDRTEREPSNGAPARATSDGTSSAGSSTDARSGERDGAKAHADAGGGRKKTSRRGRGGKSEGKSAGRTEGKSAGKTEGKSDSKADSTPATTKPPAASKPRTLYGGRVRKLAPGERPKGGGDE